MPASKPDDTDWIAPIARGDVDVDTGSTAQRVAAILRGHVLEGRLKPGTQMREGPLVELFDVSRTTLREALSLLATERLVEHRRNKGTFVRRLGIGELADVCALRRSLECGALREAAVLPRLARSGVERVTQAAAAAVQARDVEDWTAVGAANAEVHLALAGLAENPRLDVAMASVMAEMHLGFLLLPDARAMHEPYVQANADLAGLVADAEPAGAGQAAQELDAYLRRAQDHIIAAYHQHAVR